MSVPARESETRSSGFLTKSSRNSGKFVRKRDADAIVDDSRKDELALDEFLSLCVSVCACVCVCICATVCVYV